MQTPQEHYPQLEEILNSEYKIFLKREDLHPFGSHKGRIIPEMIEDALKKDFRKFTISSSGNAAIAAALYFCQNAKKENLEELKIFIGHKIATSKEQRLRSIANLLPRQITITKTERPKQAAFLAGKNENYFILNQSESEIEKNSLKDLFTELESIPNLTAIFTPASSGTLATGLGRAICEKNKKIKLFVIQPEHLYPLIKDEDEAGDEKAEPLADAIVDKTAKRRAEVINLIRQTGGRGIIAKNTDLMSALSALQKVGIEDVTPNSALALAGFVRARSLGMELPHDSSIAIIVSGK